MDILAIVATVALVVGPLLIYRHYRRVRAAAAAAVAERPLHPLVARYARPGLLHMMLGGLVMSSACLVFLFEKHTPLVIRVVLFGGLVSSSAVLLMWSYRFLFRAGDQIIRVDDTGFRDCRISPDVTPWSTIKDVVEWRNPRGHELIGLVLILDRARARSLHLPSRSWINRTLTCRDGPLPLRISFGGLDVAPRTMLDALRAHLAAQRPSRAQDAGKVRSASELA
jgi:hypothetical protein